MAGFSQYYYLSISFTHCVYYNEGLFTFFLVKGNCPPKVCCYLWVDSIYTMSFIMTKWFLKLFIMFNPVLLQVTVSCEHMHTNAHTFNNDFNNFSICVQ